MNKLSLINLFLIVLLAFSCNEKRTEEIQLSNLRCERMTDPEGIDAVNPRLSWEITSNQRDIKQIAYRILVASTPGKLAANDGDLWDSGIVSSDASVHVQYVGTPLNSSDKCYWKVKTWSMNGESAWSSPAYWSMGLLYYKNWKGRWIGLDRSFEWDSEEKFSRLSARYLRKEFDAAKEIKFATAYIIGLGLYELYINGQRTGEQVLAPSPTDFTKNLKYNTFDVTSQIKKGTNAIGVVLGNGRYYTMRQKYKPYKIKTFGYPKLLFQLEIEYEDGSMERIKTDNSWKITADGAIRANNEYDGEEYDARKEMPGWNNPGFDDSRWLAAEYVQEPRGDFEAQMNENMKVMQTLQPVSINELQPGKYILDMGQNMTGWLRIKMKGEKGNSITMRFAEKLQENGELFTDNLRDAKVTDIYTFRSDDCIETWEPSFVYHGFRYVEITGYKGELTTGNFEGCVVYDAMQITGSFTTSNQIINQIYQNAYWSILGNYKGMPVDCPQRNERQPWLGDRAVGCYGESFVFDNSKLYAKWLDDIRFAQKADGCIPDVAPPYFSYYSDNMTWPGTYILIAEMLYQQFADFKLVEKHYPYMKKWLDYMAKRYLENYIMTKDSYGDWCVPPKTIEEGRGKSGNVKRPSALISTAYYFHFMQVMKKFAKITGNTEDIPYYEKQADSVKSAFKMEFLNTDSVFYGNNTLTDNLLPFYFGITDKRNERKIFNRIVEIIEVENNGHLSTGIVGAQWLMRLLTENGRADIAFKIASNTTYPGWGYMIKNGATTIWELWNGNTAAPNMNSCNHVMLLGDLLVWYYENLAGIKSAPDYPGFRVIEMKPSFVEGLDSVNASYHSVHGEIKSNWKKQENTLFWNISIPVNTKAMVYFPARSKNAVTENGEKATSADGVEFLGTKLDRTIFEIGSGKYKFEVSMK